MSYKRQFLSLVIIICFGQLVIAQSSQDLLPIVLKGRKMYYANKQIKNTKELVRIIDSAKDKEASLLIQEYQKSQKLSLGIMGAGVGVMAVGLGLSIKAASDPLGEGQSAGPVILGGAVVMLVGALVNLPKIKTKMKPAIKKYNGVINGKLDTSFHIISAQKGIGLGLGLQF